MPNPATLTVMDKISDPMMPDLDPSLLDFRPIDIDFGAKKDDPLSWTSQVLSDPLSIEIGRNQPEQPPEYEDSDMDIDLDLDVDEPPSIEIGRNVPPPRSLEHNLLGEESQFLDGNMLGLDFGDDACAHTRLSSAVPSLEPDEPQAIGNGVMIHEESGLFDMPMDDQIGLLDTRPDLRAQRESQSPLSSVRLSVVDNFDDNGENEESSVHQPHRAKKRKIIQADKNTTMPRSQMKQQEADRSAILKPVSLLSRNPLLFNLMTMQRNGGFVSQIMGDGRAKGWAPELRGILSIEVIRKSGVLKRKRASGSNDTHGDVVQSEDDDQPRLEIPEDDNIDLPQQGLEGADDEILPPSEEVYLPANEDPQPEDRTINSRVSSRQGSPVSLTSPERESFDDTTAPLLHPIEQGAVSLGTQHAVHLLRDRFGSAGLGSQQSQKKTSILFQEMLPEKKTTKADATKMFFEVLVLATKDAVKVEQSTNQLDGPIRIRGKRGLWGDWAEREAGGEIAQQSEDTAAAVTA